MGDAAMSGGLDLDRVASQEIQERGAVRRGRQRGFARSPPSAGAD